MSELVPRITLLLNIRRGYRRDKIYYGLAGLDFTAEILMPDVNMFSGSADNFTKNIMLLTCHYRIIHFETEKGPISKVSADY